MITTLLLLAFDNLMRVNGGVRTVYYGTAQQTEQDANEKHFSHTPNVAACFRFGVQCNN